MCETRVQHSTQLSYVCEFYFAELSVRSTHTKILSKILYILMMHAWRSFLTSLGVRVATHYECRILLISYVGKWRNFDLDCEMSLFQFSTHSTISRCWKFQICIVAYIGCGYCAAQYLIRNVQR